MTDTPRPPMTQSEPVLTALEQMRLFARHDKSCAFAVDLSGVNGDERAERPAPCSCGFDGALALYDVVVASDSRFNHLLGIEAAAREEMRTRDIARAVAGRHVDAGHPYTDEMPDLEAATEIATRAEDALRAALTAAAQSPVQPVLSGLDADKVLPPLDPNYDARFRQGYEHARTALAITVDLITKEARLATAPASDEGLLLRLAREAHGKGYVDSPHVFYAGPGPDGTSDYRHHPFETCPAPDCVATRAALANPVTPEPEQDR